MSLNFFHIYLNITNVQLKLKDNKLVFEIKNIKRNNVNIGCFWTIDLEKEPIEKKCSQLYASIMFNGIHCSLMTMISRGGILKGEKTLELRV